LQVNEIINNISLKLIELAVCKDDVARTDDNTWAVLLPYTPVTTAAEIAGKLSSAIEKLPLKDFKVNLSLGVGQYSPDESAAAFYDRVCKALVCAKRQDRSQVVIDFARFTIQETC
jgi:GGDEF domain-containing protein